MRNMAFSMTVEQIRNQTKTVTRRIGWEKWAKRGDKIQPVVKVMGLRKGEKVTPIGNPVTITDVSCVWLGEISQAELAREGFPDMTPEAFVEMFCRANKCRESDIKVTRIEFEYGEFLDLKGQKGETS